MCATTCLLVIPLLLSGSRPASAGSWTYSLTSDRNGSTFTDNGSVQTIPPFAGSSYAITRNGNGSSGIGCSISVTVHVQGKFTWVPATGQTAATDPPPISIMVVESSSANSSANVAAGPAGDNGTFACAAADGLSDTEVDTFPNADSKTATSTSPANRGISLIGEHFKLYTVTSGVVTLDAHTMTASATTTYPKNLQWYYGASTSVGPYTATIHAQPYGWRDAGYDNSGTAKDNSTGPFIDNTNATMVFRYRFRSTTGNVADLKTIDIYENVDYTGNPGTFGTDNTGSYYRPGPPIAPDPKVGDGTQPYEVGNPEVSHVPTANVLAGYTFDIHSALPTKAPYVALTITAPQKYLYDDNATGQYKVLLFDVGNIVEGVRLNPLQFYFDKSGHEAVEPLH